ncbi:ribose transport system ATP-binding protein [Candidatus Nanopelagicus limnes]|uniref:Autoinducer 2 import ATP-binding protein LsrA n=1 Tax=Candidatus Nanopelagicus limnae TaxID=1884634 RepID=A0A249JX76_9ACTN|nr:sugar ABC transporter ATP-binding protein [Candidatus Nanopelagicus limnes]ASY09122.1 ribose transport system ATP-binding protein [Candidatus Nanopelagicus limnes]
MSAELLIKKVSKEFPGVLALNEVNLTLTGGTVHALLGENGAGKSTLIKIITGVYVADSGSMKVNGQEKSFNNPIESTEAGIAVVHQERNLIPEFSVEENITLHNPPLKFGIIDRAERTRLAKQALQTLGFEIDLNERVKNLSVAQMQLVEIAKALVTNAKIILLDEPTASITGSETKKLFDVVRKLKDQGTAVLFVSHKLEEVYEICDTVTVLRDGVSVLESKSLSEFKQGEIVDLMVGRHLAERKNVIRKIDRSKKPVIELKNLSTALGHRNINLSLYPGEVLGMYGLVGAGRSELARSILGLHAVTNGQILLNGDEVKIKNFRDALHKFRIGYVTENRKEEGLFLDFPVRKNISVTILSKILQKLSVINPKKEDEVASKYVDRLGIKVVDNNQLALTLSGGNQQKVSVSKWLAAETKILVIDEPTVGVDVRTKASFHELITLLADEGLSIILISSDLAEMVAVADRILVMRRYELVGDLDNSKDYQSMSRSIMNSIQSS